ncbi:hypothetical protein BgiBS90_028908, partial [Biomphalaria glabrata]
MEMSVRLWRPVSIRIISFSLVTSSYDSAACRGQLKKNFDWPPSSMTLAARNAFGVGRAFQ